MLGNHPSALPERTLREEPIDYVVDGEGPVTLDGLLNVLNGRPGAVATIPGLVRWVHPAHEHDPPAHVVRNPLAPLLDLDRDLHGRAWHLLPPLTKYRAHNWHVLDGSLRSPYAAVYTSLSCPFHCSFCMIQTMFHSHEHRRRSPVAVVEEISFLYHQHGVRSIKIIDELFVLNRHHYRAICQLLAEAYPEGELNLWAYARTDTVHPEDLPLLRRAGIRWLALGIEAADPSVRAGAGKALKPDRGLLPNGAIVETVRAIQAADISVIGNYIFGLPDDTHETMWATFDLATGLNTEWANFYVAMPYPGSQLYDQVARERPEDLPPSWAAYSQHNRHTLPLRNANLSAADILRFRDAAFVNYFSSSRYREMLRAKFGRSALEQVDRMLTYRLERDLLK